MCTLVKHNLRFKRAFWILRGFYMDDHGPKRNLDEITKHLCELHPHVNIIITIQSTFSSNKQNPLFTEYDFHCFQWVLLGKCRSLKWYPFETCISITITTIIIILDYMCLCFLVCICISLNIREFNNHQCARYFASSFPFHTKGEEFGKEVIVPSRH